MNSDEARIRRTVAALDAEKLHVCTTADIFVGQPHPSGVCRVRVFREDGTLVMAGGQSCFSIVDPEWDTDVRALLAVIDGLRTGGS